MDLYIVTKNMMLTQYFLYFCYIFMYVFILSYKCLTMLQSKHSLCCNINIGYGAIDSLSIDYGAIDSLSIDYGAIYSLSIDCNRV